MAITEAQKKAMAKYQKNLASISIRIKPELADKYKEAAERSGKSLRDYILTALEEKIEREKEGL